MAGKAKQRAARREARRSARLAKVAGRSIPEILKGNRRRALLAAVSCGFVFLFVFISVMACLLMPATDGHIMRGEASFRFFTVCSNLFSALACFLSVPFAVEGVRKNEYRIPEWCIALHYMGATTVAVTLIFSIFLIAPVKGLEIAFGGVNFFLHFLCPLMCICAFIFLQSECRMGWRHTLLSLVPFFIYATVYFIEVVVIGAEAGGWDDFYQLNTRLPVALSLPIMVALALGLSRLLGFLHNRTSTAQDVMDQRIAIAFADQAPEDTLDGQIQLLAERHAKARGDRDYVVIPKPLLRDLNAKFGNEHTMDNLCRLYLDYYLAEDDDVRGAEDLVNAATGNAD